MPVMEGKALLFKYYGGVDAIPLPIRVGTAAELVETVERIAPAVGGVNLRIASPKCFFVLEQLQKAPSGPGLATTTSSARRRPPSQASSTPSSHRPHNRARPHGPPRPGAAKLLGHRAPPRTLGHDPSGLTVVDQKGDPPRRARGPRRTNAPQPVEVQIALATDGGGRKGTLDDALQGADVLLAASTPASHTVKPEEIAKMAKQSIVFALANPVQKEIYPSAAHESHGNMSPPAARTSRTR